jgi:hypothetical protein
MRGRDDHTIGKTSVSPAVVGKDGM